MAVEPISIFARIADPAAVAQRLRELGHTVQIDGPDDNWRKAVVTIGGWWKKRRLTFTHDPAYYSEPAWSKQMSGMRGYFARFPETENKEKIMLLTTTFRFSLGTLFDPECEPEDPRLDVLFAVTELLDGVLFTPSSLRDAHGRVLYGAGGEDEEDPDAVWPRVIGAFSVDEPVAAAAHEASKPRPPEETGANPPSAERVARRALALTAVTFRAILERDFQHANKDAAETYMDLLSWVQEIGIEDELEPDEWAVIQRPLGRLESLTQINSTWRLEGLVVLAWALRRFEIPAHDQLVEVNPLWDSIGGLDAHATRMLLANPCLRRPEEIGALRNRMFALHWRMCNASHHPGVIDFAEFARTCWFGPLDIADLLLIDGDLGLRGARLDQAPEEVFSIAHSAALERHKAANWLWEGPERYSEASEDT